MFPMKDKPMTHTTDSPAREPGGELIPCPTCGTRLSPNAAIRKPAPPDGFVAVATLDRMARDCEYGSTIWKECDALLREYRLSAAGGRAQEAERDAARYRHLRKNTAIIVPSMTEEAIDQGLDATIGKHPDCYDRCQILEHKDYHTCQQTGRCEQYDAALTQGTKP